MAKKSRKVRRIEIEKVKTGKDGNVKNLHKVTAHFHDEPGKEGKGFGATIGRYIPPEETYHTSRAHAKKRAHELMGQMTATPEEEPEDTDVAESDEARSNRKGPSYKEESSAS